MFFMAIISSTNSFDLFHIIIKNKLKKSYITNWLLLINKKLYVSNLQLVIFYESDFMVFDRGEQRGD